ncbi:MAG: transfer Agent [Rhodobiaceae bacterium]|nr:MAG: transfer Agent [Rhodobiaceae bacterium]
MANRHRGEVTLKADGESFTLCLTLGALAELEDAYEGRDILALAEHFSSGRLSSADAMNLLGAALGGGGHDVGEIDIARLSFEDGMAGLIRTLAELLKVTFGGTAPSPSDTGEGKDEPVPFPGNHF